MLCPHRSKRNVIIEKLILIRLTSRLKKNFLAIRDPAMEIAHLVLPWCSLARLFLWPRPDNKCWQPPLLSLKRGIPIAMHSVVYREARDHTWDP